MKKKLLLIFISFFCAYHAQAQVFYPYFRMPEHGFLPGKEFEYYPTINQYDFNGLKIRIEIIDDRGETRFDKVSCSALELTNTSEFNSDLAIQKIGDYFDLLCKHVNIVIDPNSKDVVEVKLEAIDARLIGSGFIRVHGLCQMRIKYKGVSEIYCVDITDDDEHSPVNSNAIVTRKTGTRIMVSAAIREVIEQFLVDLKRRQ